MLLALLALACQARPAQDPWPRPEVRSPGGAFVARVLKLPGQERVPDVVARWQVRVHAVGAGGEGPELWSSPFPYRGEERHFLLTDDGRALVHVSERFEDARPVLRVVRAEGTVERSGAELGVPFGAVVRGGAEGRRWLAEHAQPLKLEWLQGAFAPAPAAALELRDGSTLRVELHGATAVEPGFPHPEPRVEPPAKTLAGMQRAMARELEVPAFARAGEPLEIAVRGDLPSPAWRLSGFRTAREGDLLVLVPMAERRAVPDTGPGVHEPYSARPVLQDLSAGTWRIVVEGLGEERTAERSVEVLPQGLLLRVGISGGFAGVTQRVDLFSQGVVHGAFFGPARWRAVPPPELAVLQVALAGLPTAASTATPGAADLFRYELGWWRDGAWTRTTFDDLSIPPPAKPLLEGLRALLE